MLRRFWLALIVGALLAASGLTEPADQGFALAAAGSVLAQDPGGGAGDNGGGGNVDGGPSKKEESQGNNSSGSGPKEDQGDSQSGSGGKSSNPDDSGGQTPAPAADPKPKEEPQAGTPNTPAPQQTNAPAAPRPTSEPAAAQPTAAPKATPQPEPAPGVAPKPTEPAQPAAGTPPNAAQPSAPAGAPAGATPTNAPGAPTTAPAAPLPTDEPAFGQNGCRLGTDGCEPAAPVTPEPGSSTCAASTPECENSGSASTAQDLKTLGHTALDGLGMVPGVGAFADVANAGWYAAEGDWGNALLSGASALPFAGDALGAAKIAKNGPKAAEAGASVLSKGKELFGGVRDWFGRAKDKLFGGKTSDEPPGRFGPGATHRNQVGNEPDPYGGRAPGTPPTKSPAEPGGGNPSRDSKRQDGEPNTGNTVGAARETRVAELTGGHVPSGKPGRPGIEIVQPGVGRTDIDVVGGDGSYIAVGGPAKAKNINLLSDKLGILKWKADQDGVRAQAYFEEGTPDGALEMARRKLGVENVHTFKR